MLKSNGQSTKALTGGPMEPHRRVWKSVPYSAFTGLVGLDSPASEQVDIGLDAGVQAFDGLQLRKSGITDITRRHGHSDPLSRASN